MCTLLSTYPVICELWNIVARERGVSQNNIIHQAFWLYLISAKCEGTNEVRHFWCHLVVWLSRSASWNNPRILLFYLKNWTNCAAWKTVAQEWATKTNRDLLPRMGWLNVRNRQQNDGCDTGNVGRTIAEKACWRGMQHQMVVFFSSNGPRSPQFCWILVKCSGTMTKTWNLFAISMTWNPELQRWCSKSTIESFTGFIGRDLQKQETKKTLFSIST